MVRRRRIEDNSELYLPMSIIDELFCSSGEYNLVDRKKGDFY